MKSLLLGIDVGTSNVKAVLITPQGELCAEAHHPYETTHLRPGWVEQNPLDWWEGVIRVTRSVMGQFGADPAQVAGIGVSGQGCALTMLDENDAIVRPAITAMDSRSEEQCQQLRDCCGETLLKLGGKQPAPYNSDPSLMWLAQHEPKSIERTRINLTTTGYINYKLTGQPVENISDASILFAFDLTQGAWSEDLINQFGLPRHLYPKVAQCAEVIGGLTAEAAKALGLREGTPVVAGGEDTSSAGLAMGVVRPGQALLSMGTASTIYIVQDKPTFHPQMLAFYHVLAGQILLGASMIGGGAAFKWAKQALTPDLDYTALAELAAESPAGAEGVIFLPYLSGELQPINDGHARAVFFGMSMNTQRKHLIRAVIEGSAYAIAHNLSVAAEAGAQVDEIRATGGPMRSPIWRQIIADVTGRQVAVLVDNPGAPLGDALLAGVGVGLIDDVAALATQAAGETAIYQPDPQAHAHYQKLFGIYRDLYPALKPHYDRLMHVYDGLS
jgi:xylulokinase